MSRGRYRCSGCGHVYDPEQGDEAGEVPPGTSFDELVESWTCPTCQTPKLEFEEVEE